MKMWHKSVAVWLLVGVIVLCGCGAREQGEVAAPDVVVGKETGAQEDGAGQNSSATQEGDSQEDDSQVWEGDEGMLDISAWDLVQEMKMGWNLGNTLDSTNGAILKTSKAELWETAWGNPVTTKELIGTVIDAGFNVIRIPVSWNDHILVAGYEIEEGWMDRVQEVVDYAYEQGAYVILNTHHESWYEPYYDNQEKASKMMEAIWTQIGERFADYDEHLVFEGMNEPRKIGTSLEWNGGDKEGWDVVNHLDQVFVDTVRGLGGNNKHRILMVSGYAASSWNALPHLEVPEGDDKLIVSVHAYEPYDFALNTQGRGLWNEDKGNIDTIMKSIKKLFIDKNIPVIIGEFGAMGKPVEGNLEDRAAWAQYYTGAARAIGVPCIWWDNGLFEGEGETFGLIDRVNLEWKYPEIVEALRVGSTQNP
jgi:endoglucanase